MKKLLVLMLLLSLTSFVYGWDFEDDYSAPSATEYGEPKKEPETKKSETKKPETKKEVSGHQFHFALGTNIIGILHTKTSVTTQIPDINNPGNTVSATVSASDTATSIGFPLTQWDLSAGYNLMPNLWLMAKFHLYMTLDNDAAGHFLIGPGIRGDIISNDLLNFFVGGFVSIGNSGKTFVFSPEVYSGVEFKLIEYIAVGGKINFAYELNARKNNSIHNIIFGVGAHLAVYF